jgi:hypothetical protein
LPLVDSAKRGGYADACGEKRCAFVLEPHRREPIAKLTQDHAVAALSAAVPVVLCSHYRVRPGLVRDR